jgi:flagellar basal body rod protein FlgB
MIELNKINNYLDIDEERCEIIDSNIEFITNLDLIKFKISQYNILK